MVWVRLPYEVLEGLRVGCAVCVGVGCVPISVCTVAILYRDFCSVAICVDDLLHECREFVDCLVVEVELIG